MSTKSQQFVAQRLARQAAGMKKSRNEQRYRQAIAFDLSNLARHLAEAEANSDKLTVAKITRAIIDKTRSLIGPVPDEQKWPERYGPKEFFAFDVNVAVMDARNCGASDDDLAMALAQAIRGGTDEPEAGSLAETLFMWAGLRAVHAELASQGIA